MALDTRNNTERAVTDTMRSGAEIAVSEQLSIESTVVKSSTSVSVVQTSAEAEKDKMTPREHRDAVVKLIATINETADDLVGSVDSGELDSTSSVMDGLGELFNLKNDADKALKNVFDGMTTVSADALEEFGALFTQFGELLGKLSQAVQDTTGKDPKSGPEGSDCTHETPSDKLPEGKPKPTLQDVMSKGESTLDDFQKLDDEITDLLRVLTHDPSNAKLSDSVDLSRILNLVKSQISEIKSDAAGLVTSDNPDLDGAMNKLTHQEKVADNIADYISSLKTDKKTDTSADPNWTNFPKPTSRDDLAKLANEFLDDTELLDKALLELMMKPKDPSDPSVADGIDWSNFRNQVFQVKSDFKKGLAPLLEGDLKSGKYSDSEIEAAFKFMKEMNQKLETIEGKVAPFSDKINGGSPLPNTPVPSDKGPLKVEQGRVWGDPHFMGADGGIYDVQGEAGKTYNILSDKGIQVNARFDNFGAAGSGMTVMGAIGVTLHADKVSVDKTGQVTVNGQLVGAGSHLNGRLTVGADGKVHIKEEEYSFTIDPQKHGAGDHLNIENIRSENAAADGVLPTGLWGGSVDYDSTARNGDTGTGTQGGGAIEDLNGNIVKRGDKTAVKTYEVSNIFDTSFSNHNKFGSVTAPGQTSSSPSNSPQPFGIIDFARIQLGFGNTTTFMSGVGFGISNDDDQSNNNSRPTFRYRR